MGAAGTKERQYRVVIIDNYDSFTYNLAQYLGELGTDLTVYRNDAITVAALRRSAPDYLVVSPGPSVPERAGISMAAICELGPDVPILGVCLGHQAIAAAYGGKVVRSRRVIHGEASPVFHDCRTIFSGLANPLTAGRYHSLVVEEESLPACLEVTARTDDGVVMGIRHRRYPVEGVQFHPESILTAEGKKMLRNFLRCYAHREGRK